MSYVIMYTTDFVIRCVGVLLTHYNHLSFMKIVEKNVHQSLIFLSKLDNIAWRHDTKTQPFSVLLYNEHILF